MIKISKKIIFQRWDSLPDNLREALASEENSNLLERLSKSESLPPEKFKDFSKFAGYVMLGFIHPDDLGKELQDNLHLPFQTAKNLQTTLKEKVFDLYTEDLQKVYRPVSEEDFGLAPDRRTEERSSAPKPVLMKETPGPAILRQEEIIPKPGSAAMPKPSAPIPKPQAQVPTPPGGFKPGTPSRPQVLSPFSFEREARPLKAPTEFKLGGVPRPSMSNVSSAPVPPRPARVELGKEEVKKVPAPESKIVGREPVHYTEPKSAFMPAGAQRIQTEPTAPPMPKKPGVPLPSYPRPIPKNNTDAIPNPTIH
jgi:hypothetical protein